VGLTSRPTKAKGMTRDPMVEGARPKKSKRKKASPEFCGRGGLDGRDWGLLKTGEDCNKEGEGRNFDKTAAQRGRTPGVGSATTPR